MDSQQLRQANKLARQAEREQKKAMHHEMKAARLEARAMNAALHGKPLKSASLSVRAGNQAATASRMDSRSTTHSQQAARKLVCPSPHCYQPMHPLPVDQAAANARLAAEHATAAASQAHVAAATAQAAAAQRTQVHSHHSTYPPAYNPAFPSQAPPTYRP